MPNNLVLQNEICAWKLAHEFAEEFGVEWTDIMLGYEKHGLQTYIDDPRYNSQLVYRQDPIMVY